MASIVVDDFDTGKVRDKPQESKPDGMQQESIRHILDEAEHRKHEFWKLIDEYSDVVEKVKKIEQKERLSDASKKV